MQMIQLIHIVPRIVPVGDFVVVVVVDCVVVDFVGVDCVVVVVLLL